MGSVALEGFGSGGAGLNFKVVSYNTVEELLAAAPMENTIGMITDRPITGWYFSAMQPDAPADGEIWIETGTPSSVEFNALKKNVIQVYPVSAKQYIEGAWADKTAKSYQGGKWVDWWTNELYTPGNEWEGITGGWTGTGVKSSSTSSVSAGVPGITREAGKIIADPSSVAGVFHTAKKIDLRYFNYITFTGNFTRGGSAEINLLCGCWESFGTYYSTSYVAATEMNKTSATEIKVNISNVNRECYVGIGMVSGSNAEITSILLS